jgi:DNA-binding IclR family transcriptional regulator
MLVVLEARGRVEQGPTGYRTGVAMLFGAHAYLATNPVAVASTPVLQELATATGLTASVFVRAGDSRAVVARVEGKNPLRYLLPIGQRLPLHLGAGKILAAYMPSGEVDDLLDRVGDLTRVSGQVLTHDELRAELTSIRQDGVAVSTDERVVGTSSVAAPVLRQDGSCIAAVQVAGPSGDEAFRDKTALAVEVRQAAAALAARLA